MQGIRFSELEFEANSQLGFHFSELRNSTLPSHKAYTTYYRSIGVRISISEVAKCVGIPKYLRRTKNCTVIDMNFETSKTQSKRCMTGNLIVHWNSDVSYELVHLNRHRCNKLRSIDIVYVLPYSFRHACHLSPVRLYTRQILYGLDNVPCTTSPFPL